MGLVMKFSDTVVDTLQCKSRGGRELREAIPVTFQCPRHCSRLIITGFKPLSIPESLKLNVLPGKVQETF